MRRHVISLLAVFVHPSTYLEGFPEDAIAVELSLHRRLW